MNNTPKTNAAWFPHSDGGVMIQVVRADFARELERDLNVAIRAYELMRDKLKQGEEESK